MSDVITVRDITNEMLRLSQMLEQKGEALADAAHQHAIAEHAYRQAHATAVLTASGTGVDKKAKADKAAGEEMRKRNEWRAQETVLIEYCRNLRQQLQTLSAAAYSHKVEVELAGRFT